MPSGSLASAALVVDSVLATGGRRIVDLGMGTGKYGYLLREQHDIAQGRHDLHLTGVEAYEPYIGEIQRLVYDTIVVSDIRDFLERAESFDVALMLDVIEHFEPDDAVLLVDKALQNATYVFLSTPYNYFPQADEENPLERHLSWWTRPALVELAQRVGALAKVGRAYHTNVACLSARAAPVLLVESSARAVLRAVRDTVPDRVYHSLRGETGPSLS